MGKAVDGLLGSPPAIGGRCTVRLDRLVRESGHPGQTKGKHSAVALQSQPFVIACRAIRATDWRRFNH